MSSDNSNFKILIAEDNHVNQLLMNRIVLKAGYQVDMVNNGFKALEKIKEQKYDMILMDVQMPEMNGLETTVQILEKYPNDRPVIVAITAGSFYDDVNLCKQAGMDDILEKPFKLEELRAIVDKWRKK